MKLLAKLRLQGPVLSKNEQRKVTGGGWWPSTRQECENCGGEWSPPLCALPSNSPCI